MFSSASSRHSSRPPAYDRPPSYCTDDPDDIEMTDVEAHVPAPPPSESAPSLAVPVHVPAPTKPTSAPELAVPAPCRYAKTPSATAGATHGAITPPVYRRQQTIYYPKPMPAAELRAWSHFLTWLFLVLFFGGLVLFILGTVKYFIPTGDGHTWPDKKWERIYSVGLFMLPSGAVLGMGLCLAEFCPCCILDDEVRGGRKAGIGRRLNVQWLGR